MERRRLSRRTFVGGALAAPAVAAVPFGQRGVAAQDQIVATMITNTAGLGDQNFNDLANAGGNLAVEDFGIEWRVIESIDAAAYVPNMTAAAEQGQLSIAVGFLLTAAVDAVAPQFPDRFFTIIDSAVEQPNVQSVLFREQEAAFLTGVAAGLSTQTNKLGVIGGERIPPVVRYEVGFRAGIASVNPEAEVLVAYVDSFEDPESGKEFALAQLSDGADILFPIAGLTGVGGYEAVKELDRQGEQWVLGADVTQDHLAPGFELAVCRKGVDSGVYRAIQQTVEGNFEPGINSLGLAEGGVGFEDPDNRVSEEALAEVEAFQQRILDGEIAVPSADEEFEAFMAEA
jgi:basic membrane protein A and related proteins